ncbi:bacteriocin [Chryseobacterium kwangjuense]|uniref:Bacteriocin n=1 Tax=Chryseobacterium kwangjuense TaxID=267125 RepID=A0ABW9JXN4_9FLAO|nr:bacteriocin [Chryseobacterium kwangjuense]
MKELTKKELKFINGGFACYCEGSYVESIPILHHVYKDVTEEHCLYLQ